MLVLSLSRCLLIIKPIHLTNMRASLYNFSLTVHRYYSFVFFSIRSYSVCCAMPFCCIMPIFFFLLFVHLILLFCLISFFFRGCIGFALPKLFFFCSSSAYSPFSVCSSHTTGRFLCNGHTLIWNKRILRLDVCTVWCSLSIG